MELAAGGAVLAWKRALQRCVETRSFALVDQSVVLAFVDPARVFHPVQALVKRGAEEGEADPLVVVLRLHPDVSALLNRLDQSASARTMVDAVVESLVFRERAIATVNGAATLASVPFLAPQSVNLEGGALRVYGESEQSASQALAMMTLAITSDDQRLSEVTELDRVVVVVEHAGGYLARDCIVSASGSWEQEIVLPRLFKIQKREWSSTSIAQLSLDDALEEFEVAFLEEQEINGTSTGTDRKEAQRSLSIDVTAAFDVRDLSRSARGSAFLSDLDDTATLSANAAPPVVLLSRWGGLENIRSLLCKPPPQSKSTLCFSGGSQFASMQRVSGPRKSFALLQNLEHAIRSNSTHASWKTAGSELTAAEAVQKFKRFLHNIDQDDLYGGGVDGDDNTNNTIESTVSMALEGERELMQNLSGRSDLDPVEKLWDFLARNADSADQLQLLLQEFMVYLSNTRIFPAPHPDNASQLAKLIRLRHNEIQESPTTTSFAASAQQLLTQPLELFGFVIEAGEWKMKRDVASALTLAGFSTQECSEFVRAMPRFDPHNRTTVHVHWQAMDRVLQLCSSGQTIHLPVSFMRKAVHDCVAFYARSGGGAATDPSILIDLQSFVPDRVRANIADPLYWDVRIAFNADFEHRLHLCQDVFHPTAKLRNASEELVLDDVTLRALHRKTPEELLLERDVVSFITKLEDDREKRLYEQLHDIDMPTGMTRYDCMVRRLEVFP